MGKTGTYSLNDLLAVRQASAAEFGLGNIYQTIAADLALYNATVMDELNLLAQPVTVQSMTYGTAATLAMTEVDEFGAPASAKNIIGDTVSFPLRLYRTSAGFTSKYFETATPAEIAEKYMQVKRGHADQILNDIKLALFKSTNYDFVDSNYNGVTLSIKRLINADSSRMSPISGSTTSDGATHQHYVPRISTLANADIDNAIQNVWEHGHTAGMKVFIPFASKVAVSALSEFTALSYAGISPASSAELTARKIDYSDLENQMIGYWNKGSAEVWVKKWMPKNYILVAATDVAEKVLGFRQRPQASLQGLRLAAEINDYPLIAKFWEAEFGFGVLNRTAAVALYTGNTTWADAS